MQSVQRVRAALDALSSDIERWRVARPGEEFPETVLNLLGEEAKRAGRLHARAILISVEP